MTTDMTAPLPVPDEEALTTQRRQPSLLARPFLDTAYLIVGLPLAIASFVVMVTGISLSVSLLIVWVGIPLAVLTLYVARVFAIIERSRVRAVGVAMPPAIYRPVAKGWRGLLSSLRDPQAWLDVLHGLLVFPVAIATFVIAVTWWAGTLGGLTFWFWSRWLPADDADSETLPELLDWSISESALYFLIGLGFLVTLIPVLRGSAALQSGLARVLLGNEHVRALQDRVTTLTASRAAVVEAEAQSLRRLERDIHDGPQQRLVRLGMDLSVAERRLVDDPSGAASLLAEARTQTSEALAELRALSRGIAPPVLADRGLPAALAAVTARSTVRADLQVAMPDGERLPAAVENAAYFVVSEALANVAKHSCAHTVHVRLQREGDVLRVEVEDDGVGGAHPAKGHGLAGLADRVAGVDGKLSVTSPAGGPTVVAASIPCASS